LSEERYTGWDDLVISDEEKPALHAAAAIFVVSGDASELEAVLSRIGAATNFNAVQFSLDGVRYYRAPNGKWSARKDEQRPPSKPFVDTSPPPRELPDDEMDRLIAEIGERWLRSEMLPSASVSRQDVQTLLVEVGRLRAKRDALRRALRQLMDAFKVRAMPDDPDMRAAFRVLMQDVEE
jgi:hypothetical protein